MFFSTRFSYGRRRCGWLLLFAAFTLIGHAFAKERMDEASLCGVFMLVEDGSSRLGFMTSFKSGPNVSGSGEHVRLLPLSDRAARDLAENLLQGQPIPGCVDGPRNVYQESGEWQFDVAHAELRAPIGSGVSVGNQ